MIKSKKQMYIVIGVFLVVLTLFTTTYAFFNYTRTGTTNTIRTGRIAFNSTQGESINLTNMFPIDVTGGIPNDATKVGTVTINVTGDTTYEEGIEYLVSAVNVSNTVGSKLLPISIDVTVQSNTSNSPATTLGTSNDNYFTDRGSTTSYYKVLAGETIDTDDQLVVGYIAPGQTGVDGNVVIRAYLDVSKIAIADTYDESDPGTDDMGTTTEWVGDRIVFTTTEWNALQTSGVSFKIKVEANEGVWVEEDLTIYEKISRKADMTTQINFGNNSSPTNGEGVYLLDGTGDDTYPIYYYRGNINDNNVIFGGYCWQMVRTTDTGGIKMIYNGKPDISGSGVNISYNCASTRSFQNSILTTTNLSQSSGFYYADDYEIVSTSGNGVTYKLKAGENGIMQIPITSSNASWNIENIALNYPYTCKSRYEDDTCEKLYKIDSLYNGTYAYVYESTGISIIGNSKINSNYNSLSDVGYMYNSRYTYTNTAGASGSIYGKDIEWDNGQYLVIEDIAHTASTNTTKDSDHHYSCGTSGTTSCSTVRYYYRNNQYISLSGGTLLDDAIYKMTGNGDTAIKEKNSGYVLNKNSSLVKNTLENWFRTNLTDEVDNSKPDYSIYIEDTVYCNDRSFKTTGSINTYLNSGWNPNGGNITEYLRFGINNRYKNSWYSTTNVPSMTCPNETDRFSVSNSVAHLNYPVGLLTGDEVILAGEVGLFEASNTDYYLYTGDAYWTMSPATDGVLYCVAPSGSLNETNLLSTSYGIRPVISLKYGIGFEKGGNGTPTNPYVVKYN